MASVCLCSVGCKVKDRTRRGGPPALVPRRSLQNSPAAMSPSHCPIVPTPPRRPRRGMRGFSSGASRRRPCEIPAEKQQRYPCRRNACRSDAVASTAPYPPRFPMLGGRLHFAVATRLEQEDEEDRQLRHWEKPNSPRPGCSRCPPSPLVDSDAPYVIGLFRVGLF